MPNRQKTTLEERLTIVRYYLEDNGSLSQTAAVFNVSKSQVQYWVRKYKEEGEDGLLDRRGHRKAWEELSREEQYRRTIAEMKKTIEKKESEIKFLKKLRDLERGW